MTKIVASKERAKKGGKAKYKNKCVSGKGS